MGECDELPQALRTRNWARLRELSLQPGGFGGYRDQIWPFLLHAEGRLEYRVQENTETENREREGTEEKVFDESRSSETKPHDDERQVSLDVDRSFIIYPRVNHAEEKSTLQAELNELIVTFLRRHPSMNYFQGYHDIVSVLLLTLPKESLPACVEAMSLHRLRDAMGKGLEPVIGQLRVLRNLIRLVDPEYARILERNAPLPYFSLSNLLTLFSHEAPTLSQIQHIFDFLLCRDPSASIYLSAQLLLEKRSSIFEAVEDDDDGMLHNTLSSWPFMENPEREPCLSRNSSESSNRSDTKVSGLSETADGLCRPLQSRCSNEHDQSTESDAPSLNERLTELLKRTDTLRSVYPRSLPELEFASIFGPRSVFNTWSQNWVYLLSDEDAEGAVLDIDMIVTTFELTRDIDNSHPSIKADNSQLISTLRWPIGPQLPKASIAGSAFIMLGIAMMLYRGQNHDSDGFGFLWAKFKF